MLRRAQSHGSLLDRESDYNSVNEFRRPNGDGRSGSYANLDSRMERNQWGGSYQAGLNGSLEKENLRVMGNYYESPPDTFRPPQERRSKSGGSSTAGPTGGVRSSSKRRTPAGVNTGNGPSVTTTVLTPAQLVSSNEYAAPPSSLPASGYNRQSQTSGPAAKPSSGLNNDWTAVDAHVSGVSIISGFFFNRSIIIGNLQNTALHNTLYKFSLSNRHLNGGGANTKELCPASGPGLQSSEVSLSAR